MPEQSTSDAMRIIAHDALSTVCHISQYRYGVLFDVGFLVLYSRLRKDMEGALSNLRDVLGESLYAEAADGARIVFIVAHSCPRLTEAVTVLRSLHPHFYGNLATDTQQ